MPHVLVFAEARGGELRKVAFEAVTAARQAAQSLGGEVHAILVGAPGIAAKAPALAEFGADLVFVSEHAGFTHYAPESTAQLVTDRAAAGEYRLVVFAASQQGRDLAPRTAARMRRAIATDVTALTLAGDALVVSHPGYTGKVVHSLRLVGTPALVSIRPGAITPERTAGAGRVEAVTPSLDPASARVVTTDTVLGDSRKLDLGEAPIIVSGGRGLKAAEHFTLVEELAAAFGNAAVGATRAVTDEGWRPHSDQIGQTGRLVSPDLYVAVGISGAIQHLAGMRTSKCIVAINKDKEAPIFKVADYGIVGDVFEVVPALTAAVQQARQSTH